jgi:hypothetical protein
MHGWKRDSNVRRLGLDYESFTPRENLVAMESSKFLDIVLKNLELDEFIIFLEKVQDFQKKFNQRVNSLFTLMDPKVKGVLAQ